MQDQQRSQSLSLFEQYRIFKNLLIFPALTVMVLSRRNIGYRLVNPGWMIVMAFIVWFIAVTCQDPKRPDELNMYMRGYAYAIFGFGLLQRFQAWKAIRKGSPWHSYDTGVSFFEVSLPFLRFQNRFTKRFIDPAFIAAVGWFVIARYISIPFGYWVIFAAWCLFWVEAFSHERAVERDLDVADGLIAAEAQSDTAQHFERRGSRSTSSAENAAIPTGLGRDIENRLPRNRRS